MLDGNRAAARRWAISAGVGVALASMVGVGVATAATDSRPPVVRAPIVSFRLGSGVGAGAPVRIDFLATDTGTGVPFYGTRIAISRNGGAYAQIATALLGGVGDPYPAGPGGLWISAYRSLQRSGTYRLRVRAEDRAGNWSNWVYGPTFSVRLLAENSSTFTYAGAWARVPGPVLGGYVRTSTAAGATVTATVTARSLAWIARRAPGQGTAEVWIDGLLAGTVTLNNFNPWVTGRLVVFSKTWTRVGTHRITIHVLGTGPVEFGGLLDLR